jgi:uncharacterized protein YdiU (UPF0061 family)
MDITVYKNTSGDSLIEIDYISSPIAWMNEFIAPDRDEEQMKEWCSHYYSKQTLTKEEEDSIRTMALMHPKLIPQEFRFKLTTACEILYKVITVQQKMRNDNAAT